MTILLTLILGTLALIAYAIYRQAGLTPIAGLRAIPVVGCLLTLNLLISLPYLIRRVEELLQIF